MKTMHFSRVIKQLSMAIFVCFIFAQCSSTKQSVNLNSADVSEMVNNKAFTFVAQQVNPMRGATRVLTSEYDVVVKKDTLVSFLPYFGRATQAPMDPSKGGIQFTSTKFSYQVNSGKENEWTVTIKPGDFQQAQQLNFRVFGNGNATLQVISNDKDPISFIGRIHKNK